MRIAHISDIHVSAEVPTRPMKFRDFFSKRITGYLNMIFNRGPDTYSIHVLEKAIDDMKLDQNVDHLIVSGDITNLSFEEEFQRAKILLDRFGGPDMVSVVPGNHDVYLDENEKQGTFAKYFAENASSDNQIRDRMTINLKTNTDLQNGKKEFTATSAGGNVDCDGLFPFVRVRKRVAIVGLNSGIATPWFMARGTVSEQQLETAQQMLSIADQLHTKQDQMTPTDDKQESTEVIPSSSPSNPTSILCKIMVLHHPPRICYDARKEHHHGLTNVKQVQDFAARQNIHIALYGHNHLPYQGVLDNNVRTKVFDAGSGTYTGDTETMARYNVYEICETNGQLQRVYARVWDPEASRFITKELEVHT